MKKVLAIMMALVLVFSVSAMAKTKVKIKANNDVKIKIGGKTLSSGGTYLGAKGMGIGLEGGWSNGIVFKSWLSDTSAVQLDANFGIGWGGGIGLGAAYLIHNFDIIEMSEMKLPLYFGIKGGANFFGTSGLYSSAGMVLTVQVPLGIAWIPKEYPIDIFVQFEPGIAIVLYGDYSNVGWGPGGCTGIRYWFN